MPRAGRIVGLAGNPRVDRERRRAARLPAARGSRGQIRSTVNVDVLDVSALGVRLELSTSLRPGSVYELKVDIGGYVLATQVKITRCSAGGYRDDGRGGRLLLYRAGAEFLWRDGEATEAFAAFLERSRETRPPSSPGVLRPE